MPKATRKITKKRPLLPIRSSRRSKIIGSSTGRGSISNGPAQKNEMLCAPVTRRRKPLGKWHAPNPLPPPAPQNRSPKSPPARAPGYLSAVKRLGTKLHSAPSLHRWPR